MSRLKLYVLNLLIALDQLGNTILGGHPDETISSAVGRKAMAGKKWALIAEKVINALFFILVQQRDHCRWAIEWDELRQQTPLPVVEFDRPAS